MAVYTHVSENDLKAFLQSYAVGDLISFEGIQTGVENTNYKVITTQGPFILTLFEKRTPVADIPFVFSFQAYLAAQGIVCPVPIQNKQGNTLNHLCRRPASFISFLDGRGAIDADITPTLCFEMGQMVAQLHLAALDYQGARKNPVGLDAWQDLVNRTKDKADTVHQGLKAIIEAEIQFLKNNLGQKTSLPSGVVHADLFPDNIFIKDSKISGLIDFYFSCTETYIYDLMLAVNAWCFDSTGKIHSEKYDQLFDGYQTKRPLSNSENESVKIAGRAAAFRILMTRLNDYIFHDPKNFVVPKNPIQYLNILKHYHD